MKLLQLNIKNFGKFHNRKIELGDGIQLIYGENESGKSTVHTFIRSMLFGMERGRGRAAATDTYSRYEPWENGNFYAGELRFECDEKVFCLQRNFDKYSKRSSLVCETDGEVLMAESGTSGGSEESDLYALLGGLTSASYENTLCIGQLRAETGRGLLEELQNYATNYYVTGDSEIDFTAAKEALRARKRTLEKEEKAMMEAKQRRREELNQEASYVWRDIHRLDGEMKEIEKELRRRKKEHAGKQKELQKQRITDEIRPAKWRVHPIEIAVIIMGVLLSFFFLPKPWNTYLTILIALSGIIYVWNRMKVGKKNKGEEEISPEAEEALTPTERLLWEQERIVLARSEKQIEYDNLQEKLQELDEMQEEELAVRNRTKAVALAAERLDLAAGTMQKQLAERINQRVSQIVSELTGGAYERVIVDRTLTVSVYSDGSLRELRELSRGTLEQIYFALRVTAAEILYEDDLPIILDDTFAFYDEKRLANALRWLAGCGRQVLLFTCHAREEALMRELGIPFDKITL